MRPQRSTPNYNKKSHDLVWALIARLSYRSKTLARGTEIAGHVASFALWHRARFSSPPRWYRHREALWRDLFERIEDGPVTVVELGVGSGATTRFWLSHIPNPDLQWHGFDVFTGLPAAWVRGGIEFSPAGAFDAGGAPPPIADARITWHVGLLETTLPIAAIPRRGMQLVLFDLDLHEPTQLALDKLAPSLRPGDVLYFDEAYDPWHERSAIDEFLARGHLLRPFGSTGLAFAAIYDGLAP